MHSGDDEEPHDGDVHRQRPRRGQIGLREPPQRKAGPRERPPLVPQVVVDDGQFHRRHRRDHQRQAGEPVQAVERDRVDDHPACPDETEPDDPVVGDGVGQEPAYPPPTGGHSMPQVTPDHRTWRPPPRGGSATPVDPASWRRSIISDGHGGSLPFRARGLLALDDHLPHRGPHRAAAASRESTAPVPPFASPHVGGAAGYPVGVRRRAAAPVGLSAPRAIASAAPIRATWLSARG